MAKPGVLTINPAPFTVGSRERNRVEKHLTGFMNECEYGSCGNEGEDVKEPDEFEVAVLTVLENLRTIALTRYHSSHKQAAMNAIREEMEELGVFCR